MTVITFSAFISLIILTFKYSCSVGNVIHVTRGQVLMTVTTLTAFTSLIILTFEYSCSVGNVI